jgi:cell division protein FtsB
MMFFMATLGGFFGTMLGFFALGLAVSALQKHETKKQLAALEQAKTDTIAQYKQVRDEVKAYLEARDTTSVGTVGEA